MKKSNDVVRAKGQVGRHAFLKSFGAAFQIDEWQITHLAWDFSSIAIDVEAANT